MKKTIIKILKQTLLLPAVLLACLSVSAQHGDRGGRGGGQNHNGGFSQQSRGGGQERGGGFSQQRNNNDHQRNGGFSQPGNTNRNMNRSQGDRGDRGQGRVFNDRSFRQPDVQSSRQAPDRSYTRQSINRNSTSRNDSRNIPDQRDRAGSRNYDYNIRGNGSNRNVTVNRNYRNYNYSNGNNRHYDQYNGRHYGSPFRYTYNYPRYGQRYTSLNFNYHVIPFGGIGYCYNAGIFYRPFGSYFQVVAPPIGISINILPFGYSRFYIGSIPYYYYGDTFYRQYGDYYQVIDPPLGAKLPALPRGAKEVFINGQRYFEDNGTYYMEEYNIDNQRLYTVVGVHGVLDTETVDRIMNGTSSVIIEKDIPEVYASLPFNSRKVNINGVDYYRSPDDIYYQEITDGNIVSYQVVSR